MFSKRDRRKSKYKFGGTKVRKAEEVRKYIANPKTERVRLACFGTGALKNFPMFTVKYLCWSFFLIKLQAFRPAILLKRDSNIGAFL